MLQSKSLSFQINSRSSLKDITLEFKSGSLYGILGPNGSGKSTLLKTLSGIWTPSSGQVLWQGKDLLENDRRTISQTISLVPQNPQSHFEFTVWDFVCMGRYPH